MFVALASALLVSACGSGRVERSEEIGQDTLIRKPVQAVLKDMGAAPAIENELWLNVSQPLSIRELSGKVVLLDFWTFG